MKNSKDWESFFIDSTQDNSSSNNSFTQKLLPESVAVPPTSGSGLPSFNSLLASSQVGISILRIFDCPPPYTNALNFTRNEYLIRYPPNGKRTIQYYCSKADFYARGINSQSIVMRITNYLDVECTKVKEIHEWYENRKDKLFKRSRFFINKFHFIEYYHPGSVGEIKQWTEYPGKAVNIDFYNDGNLERLKRREEIIGEKVTEYYSNRNDNLVKRIVEFTNNKKLVENRTTSFTLPGYSSVPGTVSSELYVTSMLQIYDKNPLMEKLNQDDVSSKFYSISEGKVIIKYHYKNGSINNEVKTYYHTRAGLTNTLQSNQNNKTGYLNNDVSNGLNNLGSNSLMEANLMQEIGLDDNLEKLQEASTLERECYTQVKLSFQRLQNILKQRYDSEFEVIHERTVYEKAIDQAHESSASILSQQTELSLKQAIKSTDYLTPFLRHVKDINNISREEASIIRQNCLDALKMRLVERANIIQSRLNDENILLGKRQEQFQRSQREGEFSKISAEHEKYCTDALFRIQILEKRLADHEDTSLKKFAELDIKLASDPRLRALKA